MRKDGRKPISPTSLSMVALIDLLAKAGTTIHALISSHLQGPLEYIERIDRLSSVAGGPPQRLSTRD